MLGTNHSHTRIRTDQQNIPYCRRLLNCMQGSKSNGTDTGCGYGFVSFRIHPIEPIVDISEKSSHVHSYHGIGKPTVIGSLERMHIRTIGGWTLEIEEKGSTYMLRLF